MLKGKKSLGKILVKTLAEYCIGHSPSHRFILIEVSGNNIS
jgi:hypothetical protein